MKSNRNFNCLVRLNDLAFVSDTEIRCNTDEAIYCSKISEALISAVFGKTKNKMRNIVISGNISHIESEYDLNGSLLEDDLEVIAHLNGTLKKYLYLSDKWVAATGNEDELARILNEIKEAGLPGSFENFLKVQADIRDNLIVNIGAGDVTIPQIKINNIKSTTSRNDTLIGYIDQINSRKMTIKIHANSSKTVEMTFSAEDSETIHNASMFGRKVRVEYNNKFEKTLETISERVGELITIEMVEELFDWAE